MALGPIPPDHMQSIREYTEKLAGAEAPFIAIAVLTGSPEQGLALSVMGREDLSEADIEYMYLHAFTGPPAERGWDPDPS